MGTHAGEARRQLGEVGKGHKIAFNVLNFARFKLGSMCSGAAETVIGNRSYVNFASYNFIGLNGDPRIAAAAKAASAPDTFFTVVYKPGTAMLRS